MKILIMGDPHVNNRDKTVREAAFQAFKHALDTALDLDITTVCHTGDFCDGPLSEPNLDTATYFRYAKLLKDYKEHGLEFGPCPRGNHDMPKMLTGEYITSWEILDSLLMYTNHDWPILTIDFDPRGHDHNGKDYLMMQVNSWLAAFPKASSDHLLVLVHCHWSQGRFSMLSTPLHENYLTQEMKTAIEEKAQDLGYKSATFILGHDHKPQDYPDQSLYVIGSPTPFTFGDPDPRRFLVFDFDTGMVTPYVSDRGLKIVEGSALSTVEDFSTTAIQFSEEPSASLVRELELKSIKYRVVLPEKEEGRKGLTSLNFREGYRSWEDKEKVRTFNMDALAEGGLCDE